MDAINIYAKSREGGGLIHEQAEWLVVLVVQRSACGVCGSKQEKWKCKRRGPWSAWQRPTVASHTPAPSYREGEDEILI